MFIFSSFILVLVASCAHSYKTSGYAVASWYGPEFHGRPTSSGEIFDMNAATCAHREFPFGTKIKVTNMSNNKTVNCIVNDRGPFVEGRDLDLSYAAAKEIGLLGQGTGKVRIEYSGRDNSYIKEVKYGSYTKGPFTIQTGSFREISNATRLKTALELKYGNVYITEALIDGRVFYRVRVGRFPDKASIYEPAKTLADEGYPVFITSCDEKL